MKRIFGFVAVAMALLGGWWLSKFLQNYDREKQKTQAHAQIASLRSYAEGYALRHGHYLLVPDSCKEPNHAAWSELGRRPPSLDVGCFRIESGEPGMAATNTAPTMRIVGILKRQGLQGVEGNDDKTVSWSQLSPP